MDKSLFNLKSILNVGKEHHYPALDEIKENEIYQLTSHETNSMMILEWDGHEDNIRVMAFDKISSRIIAPFNVDSLDKLGKVLDSYYDFFS